MADTIYTALTKLQGELKAPKAQHNSFGNYNYRSAEDILEAVKPLLEKYGLTMTTTDTIVNIGARYYVKATATVYGFDGSISVDGWAREAKEKKGMDASQITGATSSYARKYAYNGLFSIDDTKDADTDEHRKQTTQPAKTAPKPVTDDKPTKTQLDTIYSLAIDKGMSDDEIRKALAKVTTKDMAEKSIKKLEAQKGLTYEEIAEFYTKKTGQPAKIRPMDSVVDWALRQDEIKENKDGSMSFKEK